MRRLLNSYRVLLLRIPIRVPGGDRGMTTAEYAVGTVAACGFAALLLKILTSDKVRELLGGIVERALNLPF